MAVLNPEPEGPEGLVAGARESGAVESEIPDIARTPRPDWLPGDTPPGHPGVPDGPSTARGRIRCTGIADHPIPMPVHAR